MATNFAYWMASQFWLSWLRIQLVINFHYKDIQSPFIRDAITKTEISFEKSFEKSLKLNRKSFFTKT